MKPGHIARRKEQLLGDRIVKHGSDFNRGFWLHPRGYHVGDIRCSKCDRFIDPTGERFPEEVKEIVLSPSGRQMHHRRYCANPRGNGGSSNFSRVPKRTGISRRRVTDTAKRY